MIDVVYWGLQSNFATINTIGNNGNPEYAYGKNEPI